MSPRLDGARSRIAKLMVDECWIQRPPARPSKTRVNLATLAPEDAVPETVYKGPCLVMPSRPGEEAQAGTTEYTDRIAVLIPWDSPLPHPGDDLAMISSSDAFLIERPFKVEGTEGSSFPVVRKVFAAGPNASRPT